MLSIVPSVMLTSACGDDAQLVTIQFAVVGQDGRTLEVIVNACGAVQVEAEEAADRVVLSASASNSGEGDCASGDVVVLDEPLNGRVLVDQLSGAVVEASQSAA